MDDNFSHGSDECALVELPSCFESINIGLDVRVVDRRGLGGHVGCFAHLGPSSFDSSLPAEFTAVTVKRRNSHQCNGLISSDGFDLGAISQQT